MRVANSRGTSARLRMALAVCLVLGLAACGAPRVQDDVQPVNLPQVPVAELVQISMAAPGAPAFPAKALAQVPKVGKAILVNIPSFELIAFEDGVAVKRSRVIVGKPATRTPVWNTETSVVRFRPTWTPTPRMIRSGRYTPGTRPAGPRNPLGYLAIRLDPSSLIYLHGTNKPQLFERDSRALSHGCVRVEEWDEIAAWVLDISVDEVHGYAHGRRTFDMQTSGVPVIIAYMTEFPDADGVMKTWPDIYGLGTFATGSSLQSAL